MAQRRLMSGPLKTAAKAVRELEMSAQTTGSTRTRVLIEVPIEARKRAAIRARRLDLAMRVVQQPLAKVGATADGRNFRQCPRAHRLSRPDLNQPDRVSQLAAEKIVVRMVRLAVQLPRAVAMVQVAMVQKVVDTADPLVHHST
jgi:hypothetical protein